MKVLVYSLKDFEHSFLEKANTFHLQVDFTDQALSASTVGMASGYDAVCIFTHDDAGKEVLQLLHKAGVKYIATRAAGYDNINIDEAAALGVRVANVPAYSPYSVAEHATGLIMALNRKLVRADRNVHNHNFAISGLVGSDLHGKTAGIIGTGTIGKVMARILHGFGCRLLGFDQNEDQELTDQYNLRYTSLNTICRDADIITIHLCLTNQTRHLINRPVLNSMKPGVILVNTARGAIIDTAALIESLRENRIGAAGLDVYENEKGIFFRDLSAKKVHDPLLLELLSFPNVLITPHQAFATNEALQNISETTFRNLHCWETGGSPDNELWRQPLPDGFTMADIL
jgi:D-lactate dehydrogenase